MGGTAAEKVLSPTVGDGVLAAGWMGEKRLFYGARTGAESPGWGRHRASPIHRRIEKFSSVSLIINDISGIGTFWLYFARSSG